MKTILTIGLLALAYLPASHAQVVQIIKNAYTGETQYLDAEGKSVALNKKGVQYNSAVTFKLTNFNILKYSFDIKNEGTDYTFPNVDLGAVVTEAVEKNIVGIGGPPSDLEARIEKGPVSIEKYNEAVAYLDNKLLQYAIADTKNLNNECDALLNKYFPGSETAINAAATLEDVLRASLRKENEVIIKEIEKLKNESKVDPEKLKKHDDLLKKWQGRYKDTLKKLPSDVDVLKFYALLTEVKNSSFSYTRVIPIEHDLVKSTINIYRKEAKDKVVESYQFVLPSSGRLKVNGTAGFSFNFFFGNPPAKYALRETTNTPEGSDMEEETITTIATGNTQAVLPYLSTSVLVYKSRANNWSWGGLLGVAVPIMNDDLDNGIAFLGGLSSIWGKKERFILNAGLSLGQFQRLEVGIEPGEPYDAGQSLTLPLESFYQLGWYIGVSYNLVGANNG